MDREARNVRASLDYAQSLLKARDLAEVIRLQAKYVQTQMRSLAEQAAEMGPARWQGRAGRGKKLTCKGCNHRGISDGTGIRGENNVATRHKLRCVAQI